MLRISLLAILAIVVLGASAVFVGKRKNDGVRGHLMLGAEKCTRGPGYWCKNISTAHECATIDHCVKHDWKTMSLGEDHSAACDLCVNTLTRLETILKANLTVDVIEGVFDEICTSVAIPAKICEKYLDPYVLELREAVLEHIKPQVTCHTIHFCNNEEGVGKTFQRLEVSMKAAETSQTLSPAVLAALKPLGPVIMTGDSSAVYGGDKPAVAPLTCSDGQVFWCKSLENAKKCNAVSHCQQVVWSHQKGSPVSKEELEIDINSLASHFTRIPLDSQQCSLGQTFWCSNLTAAGSCGATKHCIQAVWAHMRVKKDGDDVCKICKDMVAQARDQLNSSETQNDLKAVFEGSCNLMPIKVIREGCDKLVDDFVPELVEVLTSQMNPDVVCSVAGLCNNDMIDQVLRNAKVSKTIPVSIETTKPATKVADDNSDCKNCAGFANLLTTKFLNASPNGIIELFRTFCSQFSSLSDVCVRIVNARGSFFYENLKTYFTTGMVTSRHFPLSVLNMCRVNDMCTNQTIPASSGSISVEVSHKSESGVLSHEASSNSKNGDNLPCSLCDQLVVHLKDILIANTTESEFKEVLEGICKQTGAFSAECKDMVEQYYTLIYTFLTNELDPNVICVDVGLCPRKPTVVFNNMDILSGMYIPIVPMHIAPVDKLPSHLHKGEDSETSEDIHKKLAEPVSPQHMIESTTKPVCTICEYVLHFVQEQVADGKNEKKILTAMNEACNQMPGEFAAECHQFIEEYGPAFIALLIQQIDPSQVCPKLKVCSLTVKAPMSFAENQQSKGACPLCLLAVEALDESVLNNRTEANIKRNLDKICKSLPKHLAPDCERFINVNYDDLIGMLVAEFSPQEICVYIKLCLPPKRIIAESTSLDTSSGSGSLSNDSQTCILCEFIMTQVDKIIKDKKTEEEIKHAVHSVCRVMPKSVKQECDDFVNQYADLIIQLLSQSMSPKDVCEALNACKPGSNNEKVRVSQCVMCEEAMGHLDDALADPSVKNNIKTALDKVCYHVKQSEFDECNKFILKYGTQILTIIDTTPSYLICTKITVCPSVDGRLPAFAEAANERKHTGTQTEDQGHDTCKSVIGISLCQSQVVFGLMGILMCVCVVLILVVARKVRRNRMATGSLSLPYEKLYQPTTIPTHMADDFTATIVR